jgi:class 3 adenylate cyclase
VLYPDQTVGRVIAALMVLLPLLPVSIFGGLLRAMFRGNRRRSRYQPLAVAASQGEGGAPTPGKAFDVVRPDTDKKQVMVIMMTDIVGYSAKMEKDEAATYALLKEHNVIMRRAITTHRGREIKTIGDAFMVVFDNPIDALRCGITMQKDLHAFSKPRPAHDQLKVRIGIHRDEVVVTAKDVFGEGVNIAARMESITDPGGISISISVYEAVKGKVEAGYQSIGTPKMKNIANPPEVFRVHLTHA